MNTSLFLIFNHDITPVQESDAYSSLGVQQIIDMPPDLKNLWRQIRPDLPKISLYLNPVKDWLSREVRKNDYVLFLYLILCHQLLKNRKMTRFLVEGD